MSVFLLIAIFQQKRKRQHMTSEEWETYFTKLGTDGFLWRLYGCFFAVLGGLCGHQYILFLASDVGVWDHVDVGGRISSLFQISPE